MPAESEPGRPIPHMRNALAQLMRDNQVVTTLDIEMLASMDHNTLHVDHSKRGDIFKILGVNHVR